MSTGNGSNGGAGGNYSGPGWNYGGGGGAGTCNVQYQTTSTKFYDFNANPQPHSGTWPVWYKTKSGKYRRIPYDKMHRGLTNGYCIIGYDIENDPEIKELYQSLPKHFTPDPFRFYQQFSPKPRNRIFAYLQDNKFSIMKNISVLMLAVATISLLVLIFVFTGLIR